MAVNIYDIAKKTGLSVVTVSRVINNYPNVRESNRLKVEAAIKELGYKPNAAARTLSNGRAGMVALVVPNFQDAFMLQVMSSVEMYLKNNGMFMVVTSAANYTRFTESICAALFMEGRVDGFLILAPVYDHKYLLELKDRNIPSVLLDQHQQNLQIPTVTVDNFLGGYQATVSLIKGGAGRIAHITGSEAYDSSGERTRGYLKALEDNGMKVGEGMLVKGDYSIECGYRAVADWVRADILPDAVFAADDNTAFGVLDAARSFGIQVPRQMSIIGYDDHPFDSLLHPKMSTVRQPTEEIAAAGVQLLLDIIQKRSGKISKIVLEPSVVLRETTINV